MTTIAIAHHASHDTLHAAADPNGLAYDAVTDSLHVADARTGFVLAVGDHQHVCVARIDAGGVLTRQRICGVAVTPYGDIYVSRLGHGRAGAIFQVRGGRCSEVANIDPRFWRIGLHYDVHDHVVYSTQFRKSKSGPFDGSIIEIDVTDGYVSTAAEGFAKPVGVVRLADSLIVTDACARMVVRVELRYGRATRHRILANNIGRPDSICLAGDSVLVSAWDEVMRVGTVHQLWLDGRTRLVARGAWEPRGVATDGHELFVATRRSGAILRFPVSHDTSDVYEATRLR